MNGPGRRGRSARCGRRTAAIAALGAFLAAGEGAWSGRAAAAAGTPPGETAPSPPPAGHDHGGEGAPPGSAGPGLAALALAPAQGLSPEILRLAPVGPGSFAPRFATGPSGLALTWIEPVAAATPPAQRVRFARWEGVAWSAPSTIVESSRLFANWADVPGAIEESDRGWIAHWLEKTGAGTYSYSIGWARSADGGRTWQPMGWLNDDRVETEHGFVSWVREADAVRAVWLDGREIEKGGAMTLRTARIPAGGGVGGAERIDEQVCDCCATAAVGAAEGPVVVYRDRSRQEVRDIAVSRRAAGSWSPPRAVAPDGWRISACPVNGPALDAAPGGRDLAVAWYTRADDRPRVAVAFSRDAGASFGAPVVVDADGPLGRVSIVALDPGPSGEPEAVVVWLSAPIGPDVAQLLARRVGPRGPLGPPVALALTAAARSSGFPRAARLGDRFWLAWTGGGENRQVRATSMALADLLAAGSP